MSYTKDRSRQTHIFMTTSSYSSASGVTTFTRPWFRFKIYETRTGDSNPRWRQQVLSHTNATTVMSGTIESIKEKPYGSMLKIENGVGTRFQYGINGLVTGYRYLPNTDTHANPTLGLSSALSQCMGKALQQIRNAQIAMSGGTFLGELGEAIHMIRHPAEGLRKALQVNYLDKLKKLKKAEPNKWKKAISQTWLEGCFGWRPFINDLEDAMKAYEEIRDRRTDQFKKIKAVARQQQLVSLITNDSFAPVSNSYVLGNGRWWDEAIVVIRGEVKAQAVTTAVDRARVFGLTPSEFLPTVWELLPWSFLADYFTNIGDIIAAGATDTSGVAWLERAQIQTRYLEAGTMIDYAKTAALNGGNFRSYQQTSPGSLKYSRRLVSRFPMSALDLKVPDLRFELPGSPIKQLNMLALWTQANSLATQDPRKLRGRTFR